MKKIITTILFTAITFCSKAQCPNGISLVRQGQVDSFQIYFPFCTDSLTNLWIGYQVDLNNNLIDPIYNLNSLGNIKTISGNLTVNSLVNNITGLHNLKSIGGYFHLESFTTNSLSALDSLKFIGGDFIFSNSHNSVTNFSGLNNLDSIGGNFLILNENGLINFNGMNKLRVINGNFQFGQDSSLVSFNGLNKLKKIGGNLEIGGYNKIVNLSGFDSLQYVGGYVDFFTNNNNQSIKEISGFNSLEIIDGTNPLTVGYNDSLKIISGFNKLKKVAYLKFYMNKSLQSINGFNSIKNLNGLDFSDNLNLTSIHGFDSLTKINGALSIGSTSSVFKCKLSSLLFLNSLKNITGGLLIQNEDSILSIQGLNNLDTISGNLILINNDSLKSLNGLDSLKFIGGYLDIEKHNSLNDISALHNLTSVNGSLYLEGNNTLSSLNGLENINPTLLTNVQIKNCPLLSFCSVPSICNYLSNGSNPYTISGNSTGCSSVSEIGQICNSSKITINTVIENNTEFKEPVELWKGSIINTPTELKICSDGSKATRIKYENFNGSIVTSNIRFKMQNDPSEANTDLYGYFTDYNIINDTVFVSYEHPTHLPETDGLFRTENIEVIDIGNTSSPIYTFQIQIYRAPILMVHGLWADYSSFSDAKKELVESNLYKYIQIRSANYQPTNYLAFQSNKYIVPTMINSLLGLLRNNKYSTSKVIIMGHSMGGLLSRIYLQSDAYTKKMDIQKLITINTPHSGSPYGNLLLNPNKQFSNDVRKIVEYIIDTTENNPNHYLYYWGGSVKDLSIGSFALNELNQPPQLNKNSVPTHAIVTTCSTPEIPAVLLKIPIKNKWLRFIQTLAKLYNGFAKFNNDLFNNEPNDLVVSESSQSGGVTTFNKFSPQIHIGSPNNDDVLADIKKAIDTKPSDNTYFTLNGFHPPVLTSNYKTEEFEGYKTRNIEDAIDILTPTSNEIFNSGSHVSLSLKISNDVKEIVLISIYSEDSTTYLDTIMSSGTIDIYLPEYAMNKAKFVVFGFDNMGLVGYDSVSIDINNFATLDSITSESESIPLSVNNYNSASVVAHYNNGYSEQISTAKEILYQISDTSLASVFHRYLLWGKNTGTTNLQISYKGKNLTMPIFIFPQDTTIHIDTTTLFDSDSLQISTSNPQNSEDLLIIPNPNTGQFIISFSTTKNAPIQIEIFNLLGDQIYLQQDVALDENYKKDINIKDQPKGNYLIKVITPSKTYVGKCSKL